MSFEDAINSKYEKLAKSIIDILNNNPEFIVDISDNSKLINVRDNKTNKKVMSGKYEIIGSHDESTNIFIWSCDQELADKTMTQHAKHAKEQSKHIKKLIINEKKENLQFLELLNYYLKNSMFFVSEEKLLPLLKFVISITNQKGILGIARKEHKKVITTYYVVTDIISY